MLPSVNPKEDAKHMHERAGFLARLLWAAVWQSWRTREDGYTDAMREASANYVTWYMREPLHVHKR